MLKYKLKRGKKVKTICQEDGCRNDETVKGLCRIHYQGRYYHEHREQSLAYQREYQKKFRRSTKKKKSKEESELGELERTNKYNIHFCHHSVCILTADEIAKNWKLIRDRYESIKKEKVNVQEQRKTQNARGATGARCETDKSNMSELL